MDEDSYPEIDALYNDLGRAVVEWNHVEWQLVEIICSLSDRYTSEILTAHMKSAGLCDAIRSFGADLPPDARDALEHGLLLFERLREYRNHFVHRTSCVIPTGREEGAWAFTVSVT